MNLKINILFYFSKVKNNIGQQHPHSKVQDCPDACSICTHTLGTVPYITSSLSTQKHNCICVYCCLADRGAPKPAERTFYAACVVVYGVNVALSPSSFSRCCAEFFSVAELTQNMTRNVRRVCTVKQDTTLYTGILKK